MKKILFLFFVVNALLTAKAQKHNSPDSIPGLKKPTFVVGYSSDADTRVSFYVYNMPVYRPDANFTSHMPVVKPDSNFSSNMPVLKFNSDNSFLTVIQKNNFNQKPVHPQAPRPFIKPNFKDSIQLEPPIKKKR